MPGKLNWEISLLNLELAYTWRISRNASNSKTNLIVRVSDGQVTGLGEAAPNIRYGEEPEDLQVTFNNSVSALPKAIVLIEEFTEVLNLLSLPNALRFAIESAYVHLLCAQKNSTVSAYFGLPEVLKLNTSFSIPILPVGQIKDFCLSQNVDRFKWVKVKVNRETALDTIYEVSKATTRPLLIDGNEAWTNPEELLLFFEQIKNLPIEFVEQPMPAAYTSEYQFLKANSIFKLLADESLTDNTNFSELALQFDGINMKLMKTGSYYKGINQLREARKAGFFTMIGCMIETSLGISSAFQLASLSDYHDLDGFLVLKKDPFGLIEEKDGCLSLKQEVN